MAEVSICVLTYNSTKFLCAVLDAINYHIKGIDFEILVVDNASDDDIGGILRVNYPHVHLIQNSINKGVAVARNQCLRKSSGSFILFLDSDVSFENNFLKILLKEINMYPDVAIVGPRLIYPSGELQYSCRRFPDFLSVVLHGFRLEKFKLFRKNRSLKRYLMLDINHQSIQKVDWLMGACQLIRREALDDKELFDERYFFGYEDVDFCYRLKSKGWEILYAPAAEVVHYYQRKSLQSVNKFTFFHIHSVLCFFIKNGTSKIIYQILKRIMDILLSLAIFVLFLPLFLALIPLIKLNSKGPSIFKQERIGKNGKAFTIYKFRTMFEDVNKYMVKPSKSSIQITRIGWFLRRTGLDEIPQLLNVFKGEMSLVGPRPEMLFIVKNYSMLQKRRLSVTPGITGLWQLSKKTEEPIVDSLNYDLDYIKNQSLFLDIKILIKTFKKLFIS